MGLLAAVTLGLCCREGLNVEASTIARNSSSSSSSQSISFSSLLIFDCVKMVGLSASVSARDDCRVTDCDYVLALLYTMSRSFYQVIHSIGTKERVETRERRGR